MHYTIRAQYGLLTVLDAMRRLLNIRQKEDEDLLDYVKRFKQLRNTYKSYLGTKVLDEYVENTEEYRKASTDDDRQAVKEKSFEAFMALLVLVSATQGDYGEVLKALTMQFSMGVDQYPRTITAAVNILTNHRPGSKGSKAKQRDRSRSKDDKSDKKSEASFAQKSQKSNSKDWVCNCCGEKGHTAAKCPKYATTLPNDWFRPPGKWNGGKPSGGGGKQDRGRSPVSGMNGFQTVPMMVNVSEADLFKKVALHQSEKGELKDVIILDTGSTIPATFMNPAFLTNISVSKKHLTMTTNAGTKVLTMKGQLKSFGEVWYDLTQVVNILGLLACTTDLKPIMIGRRMSSRYSSSKVGRLFSSGAWKDYTYSAQWKSF